MRIGFIGCGNMAKAMIKGILDKGLYSTVDISATASSEKTAALAEENLGIHVGIDNRALVAGSDIIFLAVKPQVISGVIASIKDVPLENKVFVSIAAGKTLENLSEMFGSSEVKLIRVMPNTPAQVGEGMSAWCANPKVSAEEAAKVAEILESFGEAEEVAEHLFDAVTAVSGSSPAYVFLFIEALAAAGVEGGLTWKQAYKFAAQAVLGSAKMMTETGEHPGTLKDMVCSPAGTTIAAVRVLEEKGLRAAVMDAAKACIDKSKSM